MDTIEELFKQFGGTTQVARVLSVGASTASEMKRRGSIPVSYWPALIESDKGREIGLSSNALVTMHTQHDGVSA